MKTYPEAEHGALRKKDKKFLEDTIEDIKANLENTNYSVDELAENMNISRSQLYNKIHSTTGFSPKALIRNIRLEEAKVLLERGELNVSEIAYRVGFSSSTYFNTCFHDYFGYPPGEIHKVKSEAIQYADTLDRLINSNSQRIYRRKKYVKLLLKITIVLIIVGVTTVVLMDILPRNKEDTLSFQSIAVLPFKNSDSDNNLNYLMEGIASDILDKLARVEALKVISMSSAKQFNEREASYPEIADELGASFILSGDIQRIADKFVINVHLRDVKESKIIWSEHYDIDYHEVFNMQSDVANSVVNRMDVTVKTDEKTDISRIQSVNTESYEQFRRGMPYFTDYGLNRDPEDYDLAIHYFTRALEIDPANADVYPHIAQMIWLRNYRRDYYEDSFMDTVRQLCEKTLELNPNHPYAYTILGQYYWETGKPVKGISYLEKALSLNNSFAVAHFHLGFYYLWKGEWEKAFSHLYASIELDPLSPYLPVRYGNIARAYLDIGDFEKVDLFASKALEITGDGNYAAVNGLWIKAHCCIVTGKWDQAMEYANKLVSINSPFGLRSQAEITSHYLNEYKEAINLYEKLESMDPYYFNYKHRYAYALWMNGDRQKANTLFDEQVLEAEKGLKLGRIGRTDPTYNLAGILTFRGDTEGALKLLKDYHFNSGLEYYITIDPLFENLWQNGEFQRLIKEVREEKSRVKANISRRYP